MIKIINLLYIYSIKLANKFGKLKSVRNSVFNSKRLLEKNFTESSDFSFIQVGANDGVSFDFLFDFVTKRNSKGVVIEPIKDYFDQLKQNYAQFQSIIKVNKGVHASAREISIYKVAKEAYSKYPDWVRGIASLDPDHHKKTNIDSKDIEIEIIECDTLMQLIKNNYKSQKLDYFQVDTEGFDYEILKMMDFNIIKPSIIKYEAVNLSTAQHNASIQMLRNEGYFVFNESEDTVAVRLNKIKFW